MANLKIVRGDNEKEQIESIDGLLNGLDKKLKAKGPDEKLAQEVATLKQTVMALLDHLGLAIEPGPKKIIRQVRLVSDATSPDNSL